MPDPQDISERPNQMTQFLDAVLDRMDAAVCEYEDAVACLRTLPKGLLAPKRPQTEAEWQSWVRDTLSFGPMTSLELDDRARAVGYQLTYAQFVLWLSDLAKAKDSPIVRVGPGLYGVRGEGV